MMARAIHEPVMPIRSCIVGALLAVALVTLLAVALIASMALSAVIYRHCLSYGA
jgi:hypothetical protein